jgi:hypothetical protein
MFSLAGKFVRSVLPGIIKPLQILWNEMIAFVFLSFAVIGAFSAWRNWRVIEETPEAFGRMLLTGFFAIFMGCFAYGSFRRARKIHKN